LLLEKPPESVTMTPHHACGTLQAAGKGVGMGRAWLVVLALAALAPLVRAADTGNASEAAAAFESLYGADVRRAKATPSAKDDIELAARILATARKAANQPEFLSILCENVCDLGLVHADGYATAIEAMQLEAATVPARAGLCADRIVDIRQRQFDAAKSDARPAAGEALIDAILAAFEACGKPGVILPADDAKHKAGAPSDQVSAYKRALAVARAVKSDRAAALDAHLKSLQDFIRVGVEIEGLKKQIAGDPQNQAARLRLVRLHLVDLNDPPEAEKYLEGVQDAALLKFVPAAAKPVESVPEMACLAIGDWYLALAETASAAVKPLMFGRAKEYYERFVQLHTAEDLDRTKAVAAIQKVDAEIQKSGLAAARPGRAQTGPMEVKAGEWTYLLSLVDPAQDTVKGKWERRGGGIATVGKQPDGSRFVIPVMPQGDYRVEVRFVRGSGGDTVAVILPVGKTSVQLCLSNLVGTAHGLSRVNGQAAPSNETAVRPGSLENGREYSVQATVTSKDGSVTVKATLDGKPLVDWSGAESSLAPPPAWRLPKPECLGLGVANSEVVFLQARLQMLSGDAQLLRPGEKPAPAAPPLPKSPKTAADMQGMDLLALVDPAADTVRGDWRRQADGLRAHGFVPEARICIPVIPEGDYELQARLRRIAGINTVGVVLALGKGQAAVMLSADGGGLHGLGDVDGKGPKDTGILIRPGTLEKDKEYVLTARVTLRGKESRIVVELDGQHLFQWSGDPATLSAPGWCTVKDTRCLGLLSSNSATLFSSLRLKMLSGEAKPVRLPENRPGATPLIFSR
jgi:hypothetical protein